MRRIQEELEAAAAEAGFSGVVRVDRAGQTELAEAYGLADRARDVPNTLATRFAIASGTKGFTALTVVSLVEEGTLELGAAVRSVLDADLPLIRDDVTVEHLLSHRSGIGDYFDEEAQNDVAEFVLPVPVQQLIDTESYLAVLDGHESRFAPGERFAYCNSGYVVLALIAERISGVAFEQLVRQRVCEPAGMTDTAFLRSDELPDGVALGYLEVEGPRTNTDHLPVMGSGDGGIFSTVADISAFWTALFDGRIVSSEWLERMVRSRSDVPEQSMRYGLGFWLHTTTDVVLLEGHDAGISFRTAHDPSSGLTSSVISNTSEGAWPMSSLLEERLGI
jgi:CubicO group peptidase (beta-lactamase class C family)